MVQKHSNKSPASKCALGIYQNPVRRSLFRIADIVTRQEIHRYKTITYLGFKYFAKKGKNHRIEGFKGFVLGVRSNPINITQYSI